MGFVEIVDAEERLVAQFGDSIIYFRRIDAETSQRLERRHSLRRVRDRSGNWITEVDEEERRRDLIDFIIVDWKKVLHPLTKEEVPCTRENKLRLPQRVLAHVLEEASRPSTDPMDVEGQLKN